MYIFYIFVCMCVYQSTDEVFLLDQAVCGQAPLNSLHIMALHCPVLARILLSQFSSLARIPFPLTFPPSNYPSTDHHPAPWLCCLVTVFCLTLYDPMDCSPTGPSVHGDSPGRNIGVGCHALLQGIFPTQRSIFLLFLVFNIEPTSIMKSLPPIAIL